MSSSHTKFPTSIPREIHDILVKLNFLSMIERGVKINTSTKLGFVNSDSWIGAFMRALNHENRRVTINFLENVIDTSITAIKNYSHTEFLKVIIEYLYKARAGIVNLECTYQGDPDFSSHIKVCLDNIDIQLNKHQNLIECLKGNRPPADGSDDESSLTNLPD